MGICLDTEKQEDGSVFEEGDAKNSEQWRREAGIVATPPGGHFPMQNIGAIQFEPPAVPVIFILGGPGSGKVTHCENLVKEKKGMVHINMTDLLQQYALGNDMQDFGLLSSKTVTEVLMLEMKMSPGAKTFLVSGYPRNMRDVVEYSEKIQIVNGVVLVSWKYEVLERQIEYGAQLGQIVIELARMELQNFFNNVVPVAEYFDQSEMLSVVNGERNPTEVYLDFKDAVMLILGITEDSRPGNSSRAMQAEVEVEREEIEDEGEMTPSIASPPTMSRNLPSSSATRNASSTRTADISKKGLPPILWVLGGPGSNKELICKEALDSYPNWVHLSTGSLLSDLAESNASVHNKLANGELVATKTMLQLLEQEFKRNRDREGIVLDGFPRDFQQLEEFEKKFGQQPPMILVDCSKLQLGRGRIYDSVQAFRRRLDTFRETTLPMLKSLDNSGRLSIIDGDTELPSVRQEFASALYELMRKTSRNEDETARIQSNTNVTGRKNSVHRGLANGILNAASHKILQNGNRKGTKANKSKAPTQNGFLPGNKRTGPTPRTIHVNERDPIRQMYNEVEGYPTSLHI